MSEPYVRPSVIADTRQLAKALRSRDVKEIRFKTGRAPIEVLQAPFHRKTPKKIYSIVDDDRILGMFGVSMVGLHPDHGPKGTPWLLGTDELTTHFTRRFVKESQGWLQHISKGYGILENYIYAGNYTHLRWIEKMGFVLEERIEEFGVARKPFYRFSRVLYTRPFRHLAHRGTIKTA